MAYNKEEVYNQSIKAIKEHKLKHFDHIEQYIEPNIKTLYDWEWNNSECEESKSIKRELRLNKITSKVKMVNKWEDSDNPTLQIAAFKLIASDDEKKSLSTNYLENKHSGEIKTKQNDLSKLTEEELRAYAELQSKLETD